MVATAILTVEDASTIADEYVKSVFGENHYTCEGKELEGEYSYLIACSRDDLKRDIGVGYINVSSSGEVETLSKDRIRNLKEAGETRAAQQRKEFARDEDGFVLRYHARIKASCWVSNHVGHKIGASDGVFIPVDTPLWRFSIYDFALDSEDKPLGIIDVNAATGEVLELDEEEIEIIVRGACASRRNPEYTAEG